MPESIVAAVMVSGSLTLISYHLCGWVLQFVDIATLVARTSGTRRHRPWVENRLDVHLLPSLCNILCDRSGSLGRHRPHRPLLPLQGGLAGAPGGRSGCARTHACDGMSRRL